MPICNIVLIGASTGGLKVLEQLFPGLPVLKAAVVVVQHITPLVDQSFASSLARVSKMPVCLAQEGQMLLPGQVFLAPGGVHLQLVGNRTFHLSTAEKVNSVRPSIDVAMKTLVAPIGARIAGVVLTGMGCDGAAGIAHIKHLGGISIAQDQKTSVIYGMPKACVDGGVADEVLPLGQIGFEISKFMK